MAHSDAYDPHPNGPYSRAAAPPPPRRPLLLYLLSGLLLLALANCLLP